MGLIYAIVNLLTIAASVRAAAIPTSSATATATTVEPCAQVSSAAASYLNQNPNSPGPVIDPALAYSCLKTVPNVQDPAITLIESLAIYFQFQSTAAYLKNPPQGYLVPSVDINQGLVDIKSNVLAGAYESEYDFQMDIALLVGAAHDGHFNYKPDALEVFDWLRPAKLVSVSVDGVALPEVFVYGDLIEVDALNGVVSSISQSYTPSPVVAINGIDTATFLNAQHITGGFQDPDALYNIEMFALARFAISEDVALGFFSIPLIYPGPTTTLTFANGTSSTLQNLAAVKKPFAGIENGQDFYNEFLAVTPAAATSSAAATTSTAAATSTLSVTSAPAPTSPVSMPTAPGYPYPVVKHSENLIAGYFLNTTGFKDTAVLAILSFAADTPDAGAEFQAVTKEFLAEAKKAGKTKLIVDLQANGGGTTAFAADTFRQLFPMILPNALSNMRAWEGLDIIGEGLSILNGEALADTNSTEGLLETAKVREIFAVQNNLKPDGSEYSSWSDFFGPVSANNGSFTKAFGQDYAAIRSTFSTGVNITGENNNTNIPAQVFAAEDMILLYDGFCASTCTIFSEMMKNLAGVRSIAVGGRPQSGPMQGVGGVKGSQVLDFNEFSMDIQLAISGLQDNGETDLIHEANSTFGDDSEFLIAALDRTSSPHRMNIKNALRIGDESETPLQFVYEASDCRIWYTPEMLSDANFLWNRVANISFTASNHQSGDKGSQQQFSSSPFCVKSSTNHPTSISGGWKSGTLGPQTPPEGAKLDLPPFVIGMGASVSAHAQFVPVVVAKKNSGAAVRGAGAVVGAAVAVAVGAVLV